VGSGFTLPNLAKVSSDGLRVLVKVLGLFGIASQMTAAELPRLFNVTQPFRVFSERAVATESAKMLPKGTLFMQRVELNAQALGGDVSVTLDGQSRVAKFVDSYIRPGEGTTFFYSTGKDSSGKDEMISVVTTFFDGRPAIANVVIDRKSYYISPEGSHHVAALNAARQVKDIVHPVAEILAQMPPALRSAYLSAATTAVPSRRRVCCTFYQTIAMVTAVDQSYLNEVGPKDGQTAEQRVTSLIAHQYDRLNAALYNSGAGDYRFVNKATAYVNVPQGTNVISWATAHMSPVNVLRRDNNAAAAVLLFQNSPEAALNSPDPNVPIIADFNIAVAGEYIADSDDGTVWDIIHEIGHLLAVDHNPENALSPLTGVYAFRHSQCDCPAGVQFAVSYNACDKFLTRLEIYPGQRAKDMGYNINLDESNAVRTMLMMLPRFAQGFNQL
jgi:hypothetical protein